MIFWLSPILRAMPILRSVCLSVLCLSLGACAYRIDIQQGNLITESQIAELEPGMTMREVRYILGTPLVVDPFHQNRWDYYYSMDVPGEDLVQHRVTVVFENERMDRIEGDLGNGSQKAEETGEGGTVVTESQREDKGFFARTWDKIKIWDKDDSVN